MIVTIGSMNMDISGRAADRLRLADSNPGQIIHSPGGVGRNIAHNLALLGKKSALVSVVGDDIYGRTLLKQARDVGLNVEHCQIIVGKSSSTYLALNDETGEMVAAINDMAIIEQLTPDLLTPILPFLQQARALVIDCNLNQETLEFLLRHPHLPPIFVDGVSCAKIVKIKHLLPFIYLLKPNWLEAQTLSNTKTRPDTDMKVLANWFHAQGLQQLVISAASRGAYYSEAQGDAGFVSPIEVPIVNVGGAGDAALAGLVCGWLEGWELQESARFAQSCAAITLGTSATNNHQLSFEYAQQLMKDSYESV